MYFASVIPTFPLILEERNIFRNLLQSNIFVLKLYTDQNVTDHGSRDKAFAAQTVMMKMKKTQMMMMMMVMIIIIQLVKFRRRS
jgi:hypothetical protein